MLKQIARLTAVLILTVILLSACKKTYFSITEEARDNQTLRFTVHKADYQLGQSITLTGGGFLLTPADSQVIFVEGRAEYKDIGEQGVAALAVTATARFYIALPNVLKAGRYNIKYHSICEIMGSLNYQPGETLFTCQSGEVVIDSIAKGQYYGSFKGEYLNTSNKHLTVDGDLKAKRK